MFSKADDKNLRISQIHHKKKGSLDTEIHYKKKGEEKFDKNLRISQIHHKKKGEEKFDKNLRISQIHHKKKGRSNLQGNSSLYRNVCENIFRKILGAIFVFLIIGLSVAPISGGINKITSNSGISEITSNSIQENQFVETSREIFNYTAENGTLISTTKEEYIAKINQETGPQINESSLDEATFVPTGRIFYVAKNGNDNNPGTETRPWLTIGKAANMAIAGDTVYIKTGTYKEKLIAKNSGSIGNYITFIAYPGQSVTIDGTGIDVPSWSGLVLVWGKSYINIIGLRIMNSKWAGIFVAASSHINLKNNYIYNTRSSGILMASGNNYIADGNEIILGSNDRTTDSSIQEIVSIQTNVNVFDIKNNYVHDGGPRFGGIDIKNGASNGKVHHNKVYNVQRVGIYIDAWDKIQSGIEVYSNRVCNSGHTGIGITAEIGGTLNDLSIYNNIIYDVPGTGINIPAYNTVGYAHLNGIKIFNNVLYHNGYNAVFSWRSGGIWIGQWPNTYINNLIVRNNIVSQNDRYQIMHTPSSRHTNIVIDRNLIDGYRGWYNEVRGTNYIEGNPLFTDTVLKDFHLKSTSPAIDKGSSSGAPIIDFDGILRPMGVGYDIGSYEHTGTTIIPKITVTSPNGGENWRRGTTHTISWSYANNPGSYVKIELFKGGTISHTIISSTPNDGSYSWLIPSTQILGTDYKIKITSTSNSVYTDTSNNNFVTSS